MSKSSFSRAFHSSKRVNYPNDRYSAVTLECGHGTDAQPVSIFPGGRKLYRCPEGCGLGKPVRKK